MAASLVVLTAGAAVVLFFTAEVCDQQLASNGTVVRVCRHPQMTDPPMVVTGLVILVLLGVFFSEVSGFGITLKRQVEEARSTAQDAIREARRSDARHQETAEDLADGVREALSRAQPASDGGQVDFPSVASGGRREHAHLVQPDEIAVRILSRVLVAEARRSADSQRTRPYWQRSTAFSYRNASTSASLATRVRGAAAGTVIRFRTSAVTMDGGIEGSSQMPCRALLRSEKPAEQDPNRVFEQHRVPGAARATPHVSTA
jgi:hypothetical protein